MNLVSCFNHPPPWEKITQDPNREKRPEQGIALNVIEAPPPPKNAPIG